MSIYTRTKADSKWLTISGWGPETRHTLIKLWMAVFPSILTLLLIASCSKYMDVNQPLALSAGIGAKQLHISLGPDVGMTSVEEVFIDWDLRATEKEIENATSGAHVTEALEWHVRQSERLQSTLLYLTKSAAFNSFHPDIDNIVNDPNIRYAYRTLGTRSDGTFDGVQVWICSPAAHHIAFLSCQ